MYKCAIITLGCKVNQCESESLAKMMELCGYEIVEHNEKADVYIVNTCCVTAEGERKSRQAVRKVKTFNPNCIIAVTGCAVQRSPETFEKIDGVEIVIGNGKKSEIPELIRQRINKINVTEDFGLFEEMPDVTGEKTRAFVKIQDGCNNFCSYCIIPYVRGRERSRKTESILGECTRLAQRGFKEIVLNGIHLSSYGKEWGISLADITEKVCAIDGIERVRLGSLEPTVISEDFLNRVTSHKEFCPQYHLSLQSGCDTVLKRMNRKYNCDIYEKAVELIRKNNPDSAISTDIITGFPGETEEEFNVTKSFADKIGFAWVHVFPYSVREGTVAEKMSGQVEKSVKAERAKELALLCQKKGMEYRSRFVGQVKEVLCETGKCGIQHGLTKEHIQVSFPTENLENKLLKVKITAVTEDGLSGEITEEQYG